MCQLSRRTLRLVEDLPSLRTGTKVLQQIVKDNSSHKDASAKVRRCRPSRRRKSLTPVGFQEGQDHKRENPTTSQVLPPPPPVDPASPPPPELPAESKAAWPRLHL
ncbi:hypothetical protein HPB48_013535 [Haemaphysalis longicornis]|uniref:Uncharacterized protein n=1 Tax=Haemaphysalis longicornis TaxID=44386 RepID=A0A9J6GUF3_HAELO|nr:hypothetical protein HPB48_013535 [Haemaphysalis longicornis]